VKQLFKKIGFRKMDEMERYIAFRAQRNAYIFLVAALLIWSLYESCKVYIYHSSLNLLPCFLLVAAVAVQTFSQLILTRNAVKDDEDSYDTKPLLQIIVLVCVAAGVIATVIAAILFMGVKS